MPERTESFGSDVARYSTSLTAEELDDLLQSAKESDQKPAAPSNTDEVSRVIHFES